MRVPGVVCSGEDEVTGGEEDTEDDDTEDDDTEDEAAQASDGGLWCELASTAMQALAGDDDHGRRGQDRRKGAADPGRRRGRGGGVPAPGLTTEPGLADQAVRDLFDGHPARRLGSDPVQNVGEFAFLGVHDATSPVISSDRPGASLSRASALAACDFTAPTEQPIASAVCDSVWSAK